MDAFIIYEECLFLEYDSAVDAYWISYDSGSSFPYELYEYVTIAGVEYYIIYLEDQESVPSSNKDVWIDMKDLISFLSSYESKTAEGRKKTLELSAIIGVFEKKL